MKPAKLVHTLVSSVAGIGKRAIGQFLVVVRLIVAYLEISHARTKKLPNLCFFRCLLSLMAMACLGITKGILHHYSLKA